MKLLKYVMPLVAACGIFSAQATFGQEFDPADYSMDAIDERDSQAVRQFLRTKRGLFLEDKVNNLNISGDVRAEYKHICEKHEGVKLRDNCSEDLSDALEFEVGGHDAFGDEANHKPFGKNEFDIELNLYFDYVAERTWASAWLEFDNNAGTMHCCRVVDFHDVQEFDSGDEDEVDVDNTEVDANAHQRAPCDSGTCSKICLRSAYFGYNIFEEGTSRLDIEVGRRPFYKVFDSRVQFNGNFDGVLLKYSNSFDGVGDFYVQGGSFVIDNVSNHFGWIVEAALLDIANINLDFKYSFHYQSCNKSRYCRGDDLENQLHRECTFLHDIGISQFTLAYHFNPEMLRTDVTLYGAFLVNHSADNRRWATTPSHKDRESLAWYAGVMMGQLEGEGDWMVDFNFQGVEAQAVGQCDVSGIGRGNAMGICLLPNRLHENFGNTNYMGFLLESAYAITDNLIAGVEYEHSWEYTKKIGGKHRYRKFELQFMYGW